ncbi:MAG: Crp/Fnr family transcriptional regulator [Zetaproteobacteria bacterium CG_4_9_14_3_um_filter_53_7]|nr:MAG: Crp/Fnr family transcriptional regulator [Zetaproteobacteria bacterium CG_4_9_14_3_um_filter_53_7]
MFRTAKAAELDIIAAGSRVVSLAKGNVLFRQGDRCTGFYLVLCGGIRLVFTAADGREHIAKIAVAGDHFAEAVMFLGHPYPLDAFAMKETELLFVSKDAVDSCLAKHPDFARILIANLSGQLHHFANQIATLTLHSAMQRVIGYLLRYIETGQKSGRAVHFTLPASKHDIASHLNISPETLSRSFRQLDDLGLMTVEAREINIPDIEKFRNFGTL